MAASPRNQCRIIAGKWRGRKINFPELPGLRPTPDRVRETLFNWLQADIAGATCLDCFAGSGALGFEALSRGANHVTFIEQARPAQQAIRANGSALAAEHWQLLAGDAMQHLPNLSDAFTLVFLDPPFGHGLLEKCLDTLQAHKLVTPASKVYVEVEADLINPWSPEQWHVLREKVAGQVRYALLSPM